MKRKKPTFLTLGVLLVALVAILAFIPNKMPFLAHADASTGSCQLVWAAGGAGNVNLNLDQVSDQGLKTTLQAYSLQCNPGGMASCALVSGGGDTTLDVSNIAQQSSWIAGQLSGYGLNCGSGSSPAPVSGGIGQSGTIQRVWDPTNCKYASNDFFTLIADNGVDTDCFANAGILPVAIYNVSLVCTGNNTGLVIGSDGSRYTFLEKYNCYHLSMPEVALIVIN